MNEVRDNYNMFSRWVVQALLAGSSIMQFAFAQRLQKGENTHKIVKILTLDTQDFAQQIRLDIEKGWAMVEEAVELVRGKSAGSYYFSKELTCYKLSKVVDKVVAQKASTQKK